MNYFHLYSWQNRISTMNWDYGIFGVVGMTHESAYIRGVKVYGKIKCWAIASLIA